MLFVLAYIIAWLYASARTTQGAGPKTAAQIGLLVGFAAGFPSNFLDCISRSSAGIPRNWSPHTASS
jgi:hypothetical protein